MEQRYTKIILTSIAVVLSIVLLLSAMYFGRKRQPHLVCTALEYNITDSNLRQYVTEKELTELLKQYNAYPVNYPMPQVSLRQIEDIVRTHPMVRNAECYATPQAVVRIKLSQRVPLIRIITPEDSYFVDTDRKRMPVRASVDTPVLIASGNIGIRMAAGELADFAEWLQDNDYWQQRIRGIRVRGPHYIFLEQQDQEASTIVLGDIDAYAAKLRKLKRYYENGGDSICAKKHYSELDLRFHGQVIGRTKK